MPGVSYWLCVLVCVFSTPAGRRYQQLQNQVEQLQDDLYRVEAGVYTVRDKNLLVGGFLFQKMAIKSSSDVKLQSGIAYWHGVEWTINAENSNSW